ncbi:bacterial regulatory protein, ArsR family [Cyanobium sp. PCC 7001]|uniref:ArsR/SmtB family transcription factor n=1 Tax=Cyanobium sp. PCC 7001 TaxID=180281 RepID=UPI0001805BE7|nr:metalloregulator ArsR/SmtB family transcription factor [Cyanobium sp. PCC 7001]EDY39149.1 bacterial regulatory protein, ArsR family [Cyanobium sp. PCC 7001]
MPVLEPTATAVPALSAEGARALLKALADPLRLQVIEALGAGERCVCDLGADLDLAQSKLSFHLKVMREAGLLAAREEGRWIYYRLRPEAIGSLQHWLEQLQAHSQRPAPPCAG